MADVNLLNNDNSYIPVGGLGTGFLSLSQSGKIHKLCLDENDNDTFLNDAFFVLTAKGEGSEYALCLQGEENPGVNLPYAKNVTVKNTFPFTDINYHTLNFPSQISCRVYSPFMPHDSVDAGMPVCVFDFSVTNTSNALLEYSFYFAISHNFDLHESAPGCSECGEAHILISDTHNNNMCLSCDEKFISFGTGLKSFCDFNKDLLISTSGNIQNEGKLNILRADFAIAPNETKNISFAFCWYFPQCCANGVHFKNYYTKYFESSAECAEYYFSHKERLYSQSKSFSDNVFSSGVSKDALIEINNCLTNLRKCHYKRTENGELICTKQAFEAFTDIDSFINCPSALYTLFSELDYSFINFLYKKASDEYGKLDFSLICPIKNTDFSEDDSIYLQLLCVIKSYRYYLHTDNLTEMIENWYYISRCMDYFFSDEIASPLDKDKSGIIEKPHFQQLYSAALLSASRIAKAVNDKKRFEVYEKLYENSKSYQDRLDFVSGFAILNDALGFSYNATEKHIAFNPKSEMFNFNLGECFKCFFCTPSCYGYVEEGVDYIEINILYGKLNLKSIKVPRTPRIVQYGGRNWNFKETDSCVILDSELEITSSKKLTILTDIR